MIDHIGYVTAYAKFVLLYVQGGGRVHIYVKLLSLMVSIFIFLLFDFDHLAHLPPAMPKIAEREIFRVNSRAFGIGEFKYAIIIFKEGKGVAMATKFRQIY